MQVTILGAGLMGSQIGCEYLAGGHDVTFVARDLEALEGRVERGLAIAEEIGLLAPELRDQTLARASFRTTPEPGCDLVVESLPEDFSLKVSLLEPIAAESGRAIVATNTSSLGITALGAAIGAATRIVGTHYWNPPLLMPLVEVIPGTETSPSIIEQVRALLLDLHKQPVVLERDVPGFVWNRLQLAALREAVWLVEHGVATAETIDEIVRDGLARRWRHVGPFETAALGGLETWRRIGVNLLPELSAAQDLDELGDCLTTDAAKLDAARDRRDAALAAELRER
jgi:3-hydroxyacyl-CoA dehydrogenase